MDRERFEAILSAYGADPHRWPQSERDAALAFAAANTVELSEERALDSLLDEVRADASASDMLNARILRDAKRALGSGAAPRRAVSPYAALAASLVFGVLFGFGIGVNAPPGEEIDALLTASLDAPEADWSGFGG